RNVTGVQTCALPICTQEGTTHGPSPSTEEDPMTSATTDRPTTESVAEGAWDGFAPGSWQDAIDVRDFIQRNYTPYDGDASFLAGPTAQTLAAWDHLERHYLAEARRRRVYDGNPRTPADVDAVPAGYSCPEDDVVVGLQADGPLKRAMMPNGGWRMVETAIKEAGKEIDEDV